MSTEVGGATYVIDARVEGLKRGMASVKAEFREVSRAATRVQQNADQAFRAFGASLQAYLGATTKDADKIARAWSKATGVPATEMARMAEAGRRTGASFHEMTAALIRSKDALWQARNGTGALHAALARYNPEAAAMIRYTTTNEQRHHLLNQVLAGQRSAFARAEIEMAAYGKTSNKVAGALVNARQQVTALVRAYAPLAALIAAGTLTAAIARTVGDVARIADTAAELGMTTDQVQELEYAFVKAGISIDKMGSGLARFARGVSDAQKGEGALYDILRANNVALVDREGNLRGVHDLFLDFADVIQTTRNAEDALNWSMEVFGREGGRQFIEVLREGRQGLVDLAREAHTSGGVVEGRLVDAAETIEQAYNLKLLAVKKNLQLFTLAVIDAAQDMAAGVQGALDSIKPGISIGGVAHQALGSNLATAPVVRLYDYLMQRFDAKIEVARQAEEAANAAAKATADAIQRPTGGKRGLPDTVDLSKGGALKNTTKPPPPPKPPSFGDSEIDATRREVENYIKALDEEVKALQREIDTFGLSNAMKARAKALAGLHAGATDAERAAVERSADAIAAKTQELDHMEAAQKAAMIEVERTQAALEAQNEALRFFADEMQHSFFSVMDGTESMGEAFVRMSKRMVQAMMEAVIFGNGPFAALFGSKGTNGAPGGLFGNLIGALIPSVRPSLYASGGRVRPGREIEAGEEGPELFVPDDRRQPVQVLGRDGRERFVAYQPGQIVPTEQTRKAMAEAQPTTVRAKVREIMAAAQRPAMAPRAAAAVAAASMTNGALTFAPSITVNAQGAPVGFERRIRAELETLLRRERERLPAAINDARRRGKA